MGSREEGDVLLPGLPPNALDADSWAKILATLQGRRLVVFLDYDGTLTPIVSRPELAFMSKDMRSMVRSVAKRFTTAVVTGRSREKVFKFVSLPQL